MKCQYLVFSCTAAILLSAVPSPACFNPADLWAAGVVWNSGERVDFSRLDLLGQGGMGIRKTGSGDSVVYSYRSHYAPDKAMVYLDRYAPGSQQAVSYPRIAIIADSVTAGSSFNFSAALRVELDWFCCPALGALTMSLPDRRRAVDSVRKGNSQYWTRQGRVLPYNMWYTGDTLGGNWSTNGVKDGCGLDVAYDPPDHSLGFASLLDTFRILMGADFTVVNIRSGENRQVAAVRETSGQYYYPIMSRMPEFYNKLLTGYFEYDSMYYGRWDSVFITLALVGTVTTVMPSRPGFKTFSPVGKPSSGSGLLFNLRGCRIIRPSGVVLMRDNGRTGKLVKVIY